MSLMKSAAIDRARNTEQLLMALLDKEEAKDFRNEITVDQGRGTVTWEGVTFGVADKKLRILGFCPVCGMEAYSVPVNRLGDVADILENFKPMRHNCAEV